MVVVVVVLVGAYFLGEVLWPFSAHPDGLLSPGFVAGAVGRGLGEERKRRHLRLGCRRTLLLEAKE